MLQRILPLALLSLPTTLYAVSNNSPNESKLAVYIDQQKSTEASSKSKEVDNEIELELSPTDIKNVFDEENTQQTAEKKEVGSTPGKTITNQDVQQEIEEITKQLNEQMQETTPEHHHQVVPVQDNNNQENNTQAVNQRQNEPNFLVLSLVGLCGCAIFIVAATLVATRKYKSLSI